MDVVDLAWLAGLLEGEGTFTRGAPSSPHIPRVALSMTDRDVVERAARLMGVKSFMTRNDARNPSWKTTYVAVLKGRRAVAFMLSLRPHLGSRRRSQVDAAVKCWQDGVKETIASRKVTFAQGEEIVRRFRAKERADDLAREFGISKWSVYALHQGRYFGARRGAEESVGV